jgi:hypothetical protein
MSYPGQHVQPEPRVQAEALAQALHDRGLIADVLIKGGHRFHPCLLIAAGQGQATGDCVYTAPDYSQPDGRWWFWWSTLEPIAPVTEITATAYEIATAFARASAILADHAAPE